MGKTSIAIAYMQRKRLENQFELFRFIDMTSGRELDSLILWTQELGTTSKVAFTTVLSVWEFILSLIQNQRWMIVFDNVENSVEMRDMLDSCRNRDAKICVIITASQMPSTWSHEIILITSYDEVDAVSYIQKQMVSTTKCDLGFQEEQALELCRFVNLHPLAMELIAAQLCLKQSISPLIDGLAELQARHPKFNSFNNNMQHDQEIIGEIISTCLE